MFLQNLSYYIQLAILNILCGTFGGFIVLIIDKRINKVQNLKSMADNLHYKLNSELVVIRAIINHKEINKKTLSNVLYYLLHFVQTNRFHYLPETEREKVLFTLSELNRSLDDLIEDKETLMEWNTKINEIEEMILKYKEEWDSKINDDVTNKFSKWYVTIFMLIIMFSVVLSLR